MLKIAICEDDIFYEKKVNTLINDYFRKIDISFDVVIFKSGVELTRNFREDYDLIFLDIAMSEMDGIEVAKWLRSNASKAHIVFLTGYPEYSIEGYKVGAHRFLLKNDEKLDASFTECLDSALEKIQRNDKKIELPVHGGTISIAPSKIIYAESKAHKVVFHVMENSGKIREYYMYERLDCVQEKLEHFGFMRIHQSFLINRDYLISVHRYKAELRHDISLGISKKYYKDIENYYIRMRGEF